MTTATLSRERVQGDVAGNGAGRLSDWGAIKSRRVIGVGLLTALAVTQLALGGAIARSSAATASRFTLVVGIFALAVVAWQAPAGLWSIPAAYLLALEVFSIGLCPIIAAGAALPRFGLSSTYFGFIYESSFPYVLLLAGYGITALGLGALLGSLRRDRRSRPAPLRDAPRGYLAGAGLGVLLVTLLLFLLVLQSRGGASVALGSYAGFRSATSASGLIQYVPLGLGLAAALLAADAPCKTRRVGALIFISFAVIALPLGLRGEILFPALSAGAVVAKRHRVMSTKRTLALVLLLLCLIGALRDIRQVGISRASASPVSLAPTNGLAEMGLSVLPLSAVVDLHDVNQAPFADGASYVAPVERPTRRYLLGLPVPPATEDERLFHIFIRRHVGNAGGLPTAEAYHNFGTAGVWLVMGLLGFILGRLDTASHDRWTQARTAVVLVPLVVAVRNDFAPVPAQLLIGIVLVAGLRWWSRATTRQAGPVRRDVLRRLPAMSTRRR